MSLTIHQRIKLRVQRFKDCCAGVAAVEFAYVLPILVIMACGVIEASRAVMMHKRFQRAVAMVGDLVAREEAIGTNESSAKAALDGIMKAAEHVMKPYDISSLKMGVTAVQANSNDASITKVAWSYPYKSYPVLACNATKTMPSAGMITKGNSAILVEAEYLYKPILSGLVPGFDVAVQWKDQIAHAPRNRCPDYAGKNCTC